MTMVTRGVLPSTLLRALQRFAVCDGDASRSSEDGTSISHGLLLGRAGPSADAVAIWGVLRDLAASEDVLPSVVRGVAPIGAWTVWVRGASDDDESAERDAAAVIAKQALEAAASFAPRVALVYVHDTRRVHLFRADAEPLALETIEGAHAGDFVAATESLLLRASLSFRAESVEEIAAWRTQLGDRVFFQFPEQRGTLFNAVGKRVDASTAATTATQKPDGLSALVKIPEKRAATSASKAKKKKANAQLDNWDNSASSTTSASKGRGGDFLSSYAQDVGRAGAGYLKTLEYGDVADVEVLHSLSFVASSPGYSRAPTLEIFGATPSPSPVHVHVDALVVVEQSAPVAEVVAALRDELAKQLLSLEAAWVPTAKSLRTHHFALTGTAFPLSLPAVDNTRSASPSSTTLATQLLQPTTQPIFSPTSCSLVTNALALADMDVLFNVHEGIPPSGVPGGTQYLVDGFYGYYHYLQQGMNDKGWGCAYRSLQTLASWLYLNHYTETPSLSHRKIQQTLVDIGDKPPTFVGSREWIGSMEVGFVLDELFGISFRTLNVANGQQLVEKAQELKYHFETQGTPVMMGGGQLAFTLLGIDYNASSGECAFLILDPHYVGAEDLETIQTKTMALEGYKAVPCGWRKASTFSKTSFYNLCLPQRPDLTTD